MKHVYLVLVMTFLTQHLPAQPPRTYQSQGRHDSYAPVALFISGEGKVLPFEDGQMLEVGRTYFMFAIPDRGYIFTDWTPVDVTTFTLFSLDEGGESHRGCYKYCRDSQAGVYQNAGIEIHHAAYRGDFYQ